jgi:hypothetical protein
MAPDLGIFNRHPFARKQVGYPENVAEAAFIDFENLIVVQNALSHRGERSYAR